MAVAQLVKNKLALADINPTGPSSVYGGAGYLDC